MAITSTAKCKLCRRAKEKLFLKGDRCATPKCAIVRKPYAPGMHGAKGAKGGRGSRGGSEFGKQLAEKQKLKRSYGISEQQLRRHLDDARRQKGVLGENLMAILELRLDNVAYRMGLAPSRRSARQLVGHSLLNVNSKVLDVPSAVLRVGDEVKVKDTKKEKKNVKEAGELLKKRQDLPSWVTMDAATLSGKVVSRPNLGELSGNFDLAAVIEFYSR